MGKTMGIGMIQMYEKMVQAEFQPLFTMAEIQLAIVRPSVEREVKIDFGLHDIEAEIAAHEAAIKELKTREKDYTDKIYKDGTYTSKFIREVERRLEEINKPYQELKITQYEMVKKIKLAGTTPEIAEAMRLVEASCKKLSAEMLALPDPEKTAKLIELKVANKVKAKK